MTLRAAIALVLLGLGTVVMVVAALGLFRLKGALNRLHAGAMADTMGVLLILAGLMVLCGWTVHTAKLALALVILWMTSPISSHLIAKTELLCTHDLDADEMDEEGERPL